MWLPQFQSSSPDEYSRMNRMNPLTHCGRHKMAAISQTTDSNAFSWTKMYELQISLKFVPSGPINKIPALVQIMAWRRPGDKLSSEPRDKPLSKPMMVSLPTHICVTWPPWIKNRLYKQNGRAQENRVHISKVLCQMQVSRAGTSNCTHWYCGIYLLVPGPWCLLLAQHSAFYGRIVTLFRGSLCHLTKVNLQAPDLAMACVIAWWPALLEMRLYCEHCCCLVAWYA